MDVIDTGVLILGMQHITGDIPSADPVRSEEAAEYLLTAHLTEGERPPVIPAIVVSEFLVKVPEERVPAILEFFNRRFMVLPFDPGAALHAARLMRVNLANREAHGGRSCAKADAMIAGIALANNAKRIVTFNPSDFQVVADRLEVVQPPPVEKAQPLGLTLN